jgi:hypothetical protein
VREVRHARAAHKEQEGPVEALGVRRARADQTKAERAEERTEERAQERAEEQTQERTQERAEERA